MTRRSSRSRILAKTKSKTRGRTNLNNPSRGEKAKDTRPISRGESIKDFIASITLFFSAAAHLPIKDFCGYLCDPSTNPDTWSSPSEAEKHLILFLFGNLLSIETYGLYYT